MWVSSHVVLNIYLLIWIYFVNRATKISDIDQNHAKFTNYGGVIVVDTSPSENLKLSISDTGIGITKDQLAAFNNAIYASKHFNDA